MPMGTTRARELPDKECFYKWAEMQSMKKVSDNLASEGNLISPHTGCPYHSTSVYQAALRYIMENMAEARQVMIEKGAPLAKNDADWNDWIVRKAWTRWNASPRSFIRWMRQQNLSVEKYKYVYGARSEFMLEYDVLYSERYE
jgi:hypothetical protein